MFNLNQNVKRNAWRILLPSVLVTLSLISTPIYADSVQPKTVIYKVLDGQSTSDLKAFNALLHSQGLVSERTLDGSGITIATF